MLTPGQILTLHIDKPAAGGRMIARADGQVVLVSGAIPGEHAAVQIERVGRGVAYGRVTSIDAASPDRRDPFTDPLCGGCLYAHISYARQLAIKAEVIADALGRIGRIAWPSLIEVRSSPDEGYRLRARLHVRSGRLGFFRESTHDLCDARATRQLLPSTCDALEVLGSELDARLTIDAEIEISENIDASERAVHIASGAATAFDALAGLAVDGITGLTVDRPVGGREHAAVVAGRPNVTDVLSIEGREVTLSRHVLAFFQANRFLLEGLAAHVVDQIGGGDDVIDLYAGVGLFAVAAAVVRTARVIAVEGDLVAADDLRANAAALDGSVEPVHLPVETFVARQRQSPAVLIVDPPRSGMSKDALTGAIGLLAKTILYVSCDVATLARDARRFIDAGYVIDRIDAFDLFPNTPHVETVVVMRRV